MTSGIYDYEIQRLVKRLLPLLYAERDRIDAEYASLIKKAEWQATLQRDEQMKEWLGVSGR